MTTVAIYARYSSDNQRDASIDDQVELCRRRAVQEGWDVARIYADRAISGGSQFGRVEYQSLIADAEDKRFDIVLCESLDRLSRRLADIADLHDRLIFRGIRLYALNIGEVTPIHTAVMGMMAQHYVRDLADKTKRGQLGRVLKGKIPGGKAYGYDVLPPDADGAGGRSINPAESAIVTRIYERYAAGHSPRRIARELNAERLPGPGGRPWADTTLRGQPERGTGILNNSLYAGRIEWNRCSYVKDPRTGKRVARPNPSDTWEMIDVPELRIIDDELWDRTRKRQSELTKVMGTDASGNPLNTGHRRVFLLSGLLKCGMCGGVYTIVAQDRYGCSTRRSKGTCDNAVTISRPEIENRVLSALQERLITPELVEVFISAFHDEVRKLQATQSAATQRAEHELAQVRSKIAKILAAIEDGFHDASMNTRVKKLREREADIRTALEQLPDTTVTPHPNLAKLYALKVAKLSQSLNDQTVRAEATEAIRCLIQQIVLTPRASGSGLDAEVHGDLAEILALSDGGNQIRKHPAALAAGRQLSVVAGARCHLYRTVFRL
ncbi:recombinase family protein [Thalassobaculum sp.]|uniref:recombinase family protein n=1 Tax=Thalassobaculum sp. TaxID=2022740 RepID=UPI0032EE8570